MNRPLETSGSAVDDRMEELRSLCRLGASLSTARLPISRETFLNRSLGIEALAACGPRHDRTVPPNANELVVLAAPGACRHHVGCEFDLVVIPDGAEAPVETRCILVEVVGDAEGSPGGTEAASDSVPPGKSAVCRLRLIGALPESLRTLPVLVGPDGITRVRLARRADWDRLHGDPGLESTRLGLPSRR